MAVYRLDDDDPYAFPPAEEAEEVHRSEAEGAWPQASAKRRASGCADDGLRAVGGDYRFERLLTAYSSYVFGESMFARVPDVSKCAFATFARYMFDKGVPWIDCQVYTDHLARFGAREIPRAEYLQMLATALA